MGSNISSLRASLRAVVIVGTEAAWRLSFLHFAAAASLRPSFNYLLGTAVPIAALAVLSLAPISLVDAGSLSGSVSSSWTFGAYGNINLDYSFMWSDGLEKDIMKTVSLTLEEAHDGKEIEVVYDRILLNPSCPMTKCNVCFGTGKVSAGFTDPRLDQLLTSPCPACAGRKYDVSRHCQPYVKTEATQTINIPRGARVGYEVQVAGAGNDVYENLQLSKGNFLLRVDEIVMPSSAFKLFDDRVEATVMMSVKDALKGFVWEQPYLHGQILRIDRVGKLTVPNSTITMPHVGIYKKHRKSDPMADDDNSGSAMNDDESDYPESKYPIHMNSEALDGAGSPPNETSIDKLSLDKNRIDLIVRFELEEMKTAIDDESSDADVERDEINLDDLIRPDGTVEIKNQEDLQRYINAQNSMNEEVSGRQLLYYLTRFSRISEHFKKTN